MDILVASALAGQLNSKNIEKKKEGGVLKTSSKKNFADELLGVKTVEDEQSKSDHYLEELLDEVFALGERVKKEHALHCVADYRRSVKGLLNYVLDKAYKHEEVRGVLNRHTMTQKRHSMVRIIDERLDQLARLVVAEQRSTFEILGKVNEINGLLVNLWR